MSNTDSFIEEVTEEVRRDRLFALFRKYGWIALGLILLLVAGATWNEVRKARETAAAQALGDGILNALERDETADRIAVLDQLDAESAGGQAVLAFTKAAQLADNGDSDQAIAALDSVTKIDGLPAIYTQIAQFKSLLLKSDTMELADRRLQFEALANSGGALRLLAAEQLAMIDVEDGNTDIAILQLERIAEDAAVTTDQRTRVNQMIIVLGGGAEQGDG